MANQTVGKFTNTTTISIGAGDGLNPTAAGCAIIIILSSPGVPSISDSAGNTYTSIWSIPSLRCFATYSTQSVTSISMTAVNSPAVIVIEDDSILSAGYSDGSNTKTATANGVWDSGSVTTTNAADVAYAGAWYNNGGTTFTANSPFTAVSGTGITAGTVQSSTSSVFACYNTYNGTGTYNATGTQSSGVSTTYRAGIGFFKQASGPAVPFTPLSLMQNLGYTTFYVQDH